uniref:Uncharacterized protein n=1 Tax=Arundo donax TaxID=35708 RepID=A0A0A9E6K2_ARUDO
MGEPLLSTIGNSAIRSHLVHSQSTHDSHGLHPLQCLSCISRIKVCALYHALLPWLHHLRLKPEMRPRCRVPLTLQHPQLALPKHGRARCQLLLLAHLPSAAREAHLPAVHPSRHRGVLGELAGGGKAGGRPRAMDLAESPGAGRRLRGRLRLQLRRPRREVHGSASRRGRVELLRGGDVRREVGDGWGRGNLGGEERVRVGVLRGGD